MSMKHLTGINNLTDEDIAAILELSQDYADTLAKRNLPAPLSRGRVVLSLFFEPSTRTRVSFELAAHRLGARVINWDQEHSALVKGETFDDTITTLNAMRPDAIIIRHSEYGAPDYVAARVDCPVINAGDAHREHPTQALLDALTLRQHFGQLEGLTVAICGDVSHSRVASSDIQLLSRLGARVRVIAPQNLMPTSFAVEGVESFNRLEDGLPGCDAVMMLRLQKERMGEGLVESDAAFHAQYGLTLERLNLAGKHAVVLHPGPMNRGIEIADSVADDPARSLILKQVENGVAVRMAVLDLLLSE